MVVLSVSAAVKCGVDLLRREWRAVLVWSGLYLLASLTAYGVLIGHWATVSDPGLTDQDMASLERASFGWNLLSGLLSQVATVLLLCAPLRAVLHPEDRGFFYLRFTARELWVTIASLVATALVLIPLLPAFAVGVAAFSEPREDPSLTPLIFTTCVLGLAGIVASVWIALRLGMLLPLAFEKKRVPLTEAWTISRGHMWDIARLVLTLVAILAVVSIALFIVVTVVGAVVGLPASVLLGDAVRSQPLKTFTAIALMMTVLGSAYSAAIYAVGYGAWADLYRQLTQPREEAA